MEAGSMTLKSRTLLTLLLVALLVLGAACGGDDDDEAGGEGTTGEAGGTITVWAMGAEGEKLDVLAKDFMAENPGITVRVTPIAWDVAHDKLLTSVAGGETPDVSQMGTTWMGEFAATGALEEVPEAIDMDAFYEGARNTAIIDDTPLGVPWYVETRLLYYRTDIAEKAGITEPPANWDELKAMAKAMKEKGGARYGISLAPNNWQEFLPFVWQNGGEVADGDQWTFDTPELVEALEFYKSFFDEGLTSESVPEGFDVTQGFVAGTHPMFFSGPWHMSLIEEQGAAELEGKWAIAPMPEKETKTSFVGGSDLVVFKDSDNKDAAWKFVEYLSDPTVQQKWYETVSALPSVESAWESGELSTDEQLALFGEQLRDAKSPPPLAKWEQVAVEAVNAEVEKATTGGSTPEQAAQAMQQKAESIGTG
ncbi:MAG TPA: sugar ABC transporter substrate-binding protein [Gaiellaceae bacterium]|nr:sugar ABC transporter substrate-binding protein [Gaiellaceae bacterium]